MFQSAMCNRSHLDNYSKNNIKLLKINMLCGLQIIQIFSIFSTFLDHFGGFVRLFDDPLIMVVKLEGEN